MKLTSEAEGDHDGFLAGIGEGHGEEVAQNIARITLEGGRVGRRGGDEGELAHQADRFLGRP